MSMARCDMCRVLIDTDDHPEACTDDGYLCDECRYEPGDRSKRAFASFDDFMAHVADCKADEEKLHGEEA